MARLRDRRDYFHRLQTGTHAEARSFQRFERQLTELASGATEMTKVHLRHTETSAQLWPPQPCCQCEQPTINAIRANGTDVPCCHCCVLELDILASGIAKPVGRPASGAH